MHYSSRTFFDDLLIFCSKYTLTQSPYIKRILQMLSFWLLLKEWQFGKRNMQKLLVRGCHCIIATLSIYTCSGTERFKSTWIVKPCIFYHITFLLHFVGDETLFKLWFWSHMKKEEMTRTYSLGNDRLTVLHIFSHQWGRL